MLLIGLLLASPSVAEAQDDLARHLMIHAFPGLPARGGHPAVPGTKLTPEVIAIVQRCKDSVASGKGFAPRQDRRTVPAHPPGFAPDPRVVIAADMIDGCLVEQKLPHVRVIPSAAPVTKPLLR